MNTSNKIIELVVKVNKKKLLKEQKLEENKSKVLNAFGGDFKSSFTTLTISRVTKISKRVVYTCLQILEDENYVLKFKNGCGKYDAYVLTSPELEKRKEIRLELYEELKEQFKKREREAAFNLLKLKYSVKETGQILKTDYINPMYEMINKLKSERRISYNYEDSYSLKDHDVSEFFFSKEEAEKRNKEKNKIVLDYFSKFPGKDASFEHLCAITNLHRGEVSATMDRLTDLGMFTRSYFMGSTTWKLNQPQQAVK